MTFYPTEKLALFIDGPNLYSAARGLNIDIDFRKFLDEFKKRGILLRSYYFTAIAEDEEYSAVRPLVDWLDYNGFTVITKAARSFTDAQGRKKWRGDVKVDIATQMLLMADKVDHMILCSGDGDYTTLVHALQDKGVRVSIISTMKSQPPMVSDDLRRAVDNFIDLNDLMATVGKPRRDSSELPSFVRGDK